MRSRLSCVGEGCGCRMSATLIELWYTEGDFAPYLVGTYKTKADAEGAARGMERRMTNPNAQPYDFEYREVV